MHKIMAVCLPGMEKVVRGEIKEIIGDAAEILEKRAKVFFTTQKVKNKLLELRCADNLYYCIGEFFIGAHKIDLKKYQEEINQLNFGKALKYAGNAEFSDIIVSASRKGKHTYSRYDLSRAAEEVLKRKYKVKIADSKSYDIAVRIDVDGGNCIVSVQLTAANFKFRGREYNPTAGGIRPTVAHCLVRLSNPRSNEVFFDPFCGAGTIASERGYFKSKKIYASDINPEIVIKAKENLQNRAVVFCRDACAANMKKNSIDVVITNLPWGKQVAVADIENLYEKFFRELKNYLKDGGRAYLFTDQSSLVWGFGQKYGFIVSEELQTSLHGLHPSVFLLVKQEFSSFKV